jgi:AcrR family transcriptional regulator
MTTALRLPAAKRRLALIETALKVFSDGSYRGTTTAEIARAAGVSEPILYRHIASKRDLYPDSNTQLTLQTNYTV